MIDLLYLYSQPLNYRFVVVIQICTSKDNTHKTKSEKYYIYFSGELYCIERGLTRRNSKRTKIDATYLANEYEKEVIKIARVNNMITCINVGSNENKCVGKKTFH